MTTNFTNYYEDALPDVQKWTPAQRAAHFARLASALAAHKKALGSDTRIQEAVYLAYCQNGLELGVHCYLLPCRATERAPATVTLLINGTGYIRALTTGPKSLFTHLAATRVYEGDTLQCDSVSGRATHSPARSKRGPLEGYLIHGVFRRGRKPYACYVGKEEVDKRRNYAISKNKDKVPLAWAQWPDDKGENSALRIALKRFEQARLLIEADNETQDASAVTDTTTGGEDGLPLDDAEAKDWSF